MRKKNVEVSSQYKIAVIDDEIGIIDALSAMLKRNGYMCDGFTNPLDAIENIRVKHYDLLILDYLMQPIHGDKVVEEIRSFDSDIYILLLTGHKDLAPPMETIKALDIQSYCEKSSRFDQLLLLVESGLKSVSQMRAIKQMKDGLNMVLEAVPGIYKLQPAVDIIEYVLSQVTRLAGSKDSFIMVSCVVKVDMGDKCLYRGTGNYDYIAENIMEKLDAGLRNRINIAVKEKKIVKTGNSVIIPLIDEYTDTMGVLYVEGRNLEEKIKMLEILAAHAASSINNSLLHSIVNRNKDEIAKTYEKLKSGYIDTVEALRLAVDAKDVYTRGHSDRVAYYAVKIGREFNLSDEQIEMLRVAGVFHDIGKIGIADEILLKNGTLSAEEYSEIKKHSAKGAHILSAASVFKGVTPLVRYHHERIDGGGYPDGLKGDQIPLLARIISVADAFDAMTTDRLYRPRLKLEEAEKQLIEGSGTQFDKEIVSKFIKLLKDYNTMMSEIKDTFK